MAALGFATGCGGSVATETSDGAADGPTATQMADASAEGGAMDADADGSDVTVGDGGPDGHPIACGAFPCGNPIPIVLGGTDTGYDTCAGGYTRRRAIVACPSFLPRTGNGACDVDASAASGQCSSDSDCTARAYGHCEMESPDAGLVPSCTCDYGCRADSDCGQGEVCLCAEPIGRCVPATCSSGASCMSGCDCITSSMGDNCGAQFDCQTPSDQCASQQNCAGNANQMTWCAESGGEHRCTYDNYCGVGRPFVVCGRPRLATASTRGEWRRDDVSPDVRGLSAAAREMLAAHWTRVGLMEHASIAAFARFTLHLLAVGAPGALVMASNEALADETEHARMAFALASAYAGREVGPSALPIDGSLDRFDVGEMVMTLVREGCIGETRAAVEARDALETERDPAVRLVLAKVARDETRHAELAWRSLAWLVGTRRVDCARVRDELRRAIAESPCDGELQREVVARIVRPCADALLDG